MIVDDDADDADEQIIVFCEEATHFDAQSSLSVLR